MANKFAFHPNCWGSRGDAVGFKSIVHLTCRTFGNMDKASYYITSIAKGLARKTICLRSLDQSSLDIGAIVLALNGIRFNGWITAELDSWPNPKDGAIHSLKFMQNAELQRYHQMGGN